jgi:hypothetical protein
MMTALGTANRSSSGQVLNACQAAAGVAAPSCAAPQVCVTHPCLQQLERHLLVLLQVAALSLSHLLLLLLRLALQTKGMLRVGCSLKHLPQQLLALQQQMQQMLQQQLLSLLLLLLLPESQLRVAMQQ